MKMSKGSFLTLNVFLTAECICVKVKNIVTPGTKLKRAGASEKAWVLTRLAGGACSMHVLHVSRTVGLQRLH